MIEECILITCICCYCGDLVHVSLCVSEAIPEASPNMAVQRTVYTAALAALKKETQLDYPLVAMVRHHTGPCTFSSNALDPMMVINLVCEITLLMSVYKIAELYSGSVSPSFISMHVNVIDMVMERDLG